MFDSMDDRDMWFIAGLVLIAVLGTYAPRITGAVVGLIVIYLAFVLARQRTI